MQWCDTFYAEAVAMMMKLAPYLWAAKLGWLVYQIQATSLEAMWLQGANLSQICKWLQGLSHCPPAVAIYGFIIEFSPLYYYLSYIIYPYFSLVGLLN